MFHVAPPSVEYWNVTIPVGVATPAMPVTVTDAVADCPRIIVLAGFRVGFAIVGFALFTVNVTDALVGELRTSASPS